MNYIAFIRGIGPENPHMHGEIFRRFFEDMGLTKVRTALSSGNVIFESKIRNLKALERLIEKNFPLKLGFSRAAIIRTLEYLNTLWIPIPSWVRKTRQQQD